MTEEVIIRRQMYTETAHRLLHYEGRCAHIHGHSWLWQVEVKGKVDKETGMVMDFSELKADMMNILDPLDHSLVLWYKDPLARLLMQNKKFFSALVTTDSLERQPRLHLVPWNPTSENLAKYVKERLLYTFKRLDNRNELAVVKVVVSETRNTAVVVEC